MPFFPLWFVFLPWRAAGPCCWSQPHLPVSRRLLFLWAPTESPSSSGGADLWGTWGSQAGIISPRLRTWQEPFRRKSPAEAQPAAIPGGEPGLGKRPPQRTAEPLVGTWALASCLSPVSRQPCPSPGVLQGSWALPPGLSPPPCPASACAEGARAPEGAQPAPGPAACLMLCSRCQARVVVTAAQALL